MSAGTRQAVTGTRRWVVKIGSALATKHGMGLNVAAIDDWAAQMAGLGHRGHEIVVVGSGSVAEGAVRLGWNAVLSGVVGIMVGGVGSWFARSYIEAVTGPFGPLTTPRALTPPLSVWRTQ